MADNATDARSIRQFNERAILAALRRGGRLSKPEIARRVRLTPQAVNAIMAHLLSEGLVREHGRQTGGVGYPSVLYALRADGAHTIGLKIGRRSVEALLVDFTGAIIHSVFNDYARPEVESVIAATSEAIDRLTAQAKRLGVSRLLGIGVALPGFMTRLGLAFGEGDSAAHDWRDADIRGRIEALCDLPVFIDSDGAASAVAELLARGEDAFRSFLYVFVGAFVGAGLVVEGESYRGRSGRSAQIGAFPVPAEGGGWIPLQKRCGLMRLYERFAEAGCHIDSAAEISRAYETHSETVEAWLDEAAEALVVAVIGVQAADDLDAVIVDTDLPSFLGDRLIEKVNAALSSTSASAIAAPLVTKSVLGRNAAALGAALLPIHDLFAPKLSVLARGQAKRRRTKAVS